MTDCTSVTRLEYTLPKIVSNMYSGHRVKENEIWKISDTLREASKSFSFQRNDSLTSNAQLLVDSGEREPAPYQSELSCSKA